MDLLFDSGIVNLLLKTKGGGGGETESQIMLMFLFRVLWGWFRVEILTGLQIVTGGHSCFSTRCNRGFFEIGYHFHKSLKYWNSRHRFEKKTNKKQWSKITESIISNYLINVYAWGNSILKMLETKWIYRTDKHRWQFIVCQT